MSRVPERRRQPGPEHAAVLAALARLEQRLDYHLAQVQGMIADGIGAYLTAKFPFGDGRTGDRWSRRRRR